MIVLKQNRWQKVSKGNPRGLLSRGEGEYYAALHLRSGYPADQVLCILFGGADLNFTA